MIEDLYKTIKDSKSFMEEHHYENKMKLAVCLSYVQMKFILNICEMSILLRKLMEVKK